MSGGEAIFWPGRQWHWNGKRFTRALDEVSWNLVGGGPQGLVSANSQSGFSFNQYAIRGDFNLLSLEPEATQLRLLFRLGERRCFNGVSPSQGGGACEKYAAESIDSDRAKTTGLRALKRLKTLMFKVFNALNVLGETISIARPLFSMISSPQARLQAELNAANLTRPMWMLWILSAGLIALDGFDFFIIGIAIPFIQQDFGLSASWVGAIATAALLGALVGSLTLGPITDKVGRQLMLVIDIGLFIIASAGTALAWNAWSLLFFSLCCWHRHRC